MFNIDPNLIGRKYITHDPKTIYTLRGVYVQPNSKPIIMGEFATDPNTVNSATQLVTHQLSEVKLLPP